MGEGKEEVIQILKVQLTKKDQITSIQLHHISPTHQSTHLVLILDLEEMELSIDLADKCLDHRFSNPDIPIPQMISIRPPQMLLRLPSFHWQSFCKMTRIWKKRVGERKKEVAFSVARKKTKMWINQKSRCQTIKVLAVKGLK